MKPWAIALLIYGERHTGRNACTEEKYRDLASAFVPAGLSVESVLYSDESGEPRGIHARHNLSQSAPGIAGFAPSQHRQSQ